MAIWTLYGIDFKNYLDVVRKATNHEPRRPEHLRQSIGKPVKERALQRGNVGVRKLSVRPFGQRHLVNKGYQDTFELFLADVHL